MGCEPELLFGRLCSYAPWWATRARIDGCTPQASVRLLRGVDRLRYVGLNVHRNWCQVAEVDDTGELVREVRLPINPDAIADCAMRHRDSRPMC